MPTPERAVSVKSPSRISSVTRFPDVESSEVRFTMAFARTLVPLSSGCARRESESKVSSVFRICSICQQRKQTKGALAGWAHSTPDFCTHNYFLYLVSHTKPRARCVLSQGFLTLRQSGENLSTFTAEGRYRRAVEERKDRRVGLRAERPSSVVHVRQSTSSLTNFVPLSTAWSAPFRSRAGEAFRMYPQAPSCKASCTMWTEDS